MELLLSKVERKEMKRIGCLLGIHKYYNSNKTSWLINEVNGEYYFCEQNACIYCGHTKSRILRAE